jgi:NifB/MoaA-like Fe-S oxidoreductase
MNKNLGGAFVQLADEFFLKANAHFPPLKHYGDLPQWENGVGMVPWFLKNAAATLKRAKPLPAISATIVTGTIAAGFIQDFLQRLSAKTGCTLSAIAIPNRLFGSSVTVTGLISGKDILAELQGNVSGDVLLIPEVMLKEGEGFFLDDLSPADLSRGLGIAVETFEPTPGALYNLLRRLTAKKERTS